MPPASTNFGASPASEVTAVRSHLYVPGDRPDYFDSAIASAAHRIIIDLEDGVAASAKSAARSETARMLQRWKPSERPKTLVVRVDPDALEDDLEVAVAGCADGIVLAKASFATVSEAAAALTRIEADSALRESNTAARPLPITALIESARGLLDAEAIATHERVEGLALGEADLTADLGLEPGADQLELAPYRAMVVLASVAAGVRRPTGPVGTNFRDLDAFQAGCAQLRRQGFGARSAIHPAQVEIINRTFSPSEVELAAARALVAKFEASVASGRGVQLGEDGSMVDEAVVRSARRLLDGR
jgi:citrate lyase subunit beta/citryl-CoA lyase